MTIRIRMFFHWCTCSVLLGVHPLAQAQESLSLSGFATLGISCFSNRDADFTYNTNPRGPGRSKHCDSGLDSVLGVQADQRLTDTVDGVAQVTILRNADETYRPEFSLANIRWQVSDELTLRAGRVSNPMFLNSDFRLVHFALPTARPATEVYGLSPTFTMDGVDAFYRQRIADWRTEIYVGLHNNTIEAARSNSSRTDEAKTSALATLSISVEHDALLIKASASSGKLNYPTDTVDAILAGLRAVEPLSPGAAALADQLNPREVRLHLYSVGARYDESDWLVQGEIAARRFDSSFFRNSVAGYLTAAYRIGPWSPYATIARRKSQGPLNDSRAGPLNAIVSTLLRSTNYSQSSITLGLSRELGKGTVIKAQNLWLQPDRGSYGNSLLNASPTYNLANPPRDRLVSINLNTVF